MIEFISRKMPTSTAQPRRNTKSTLKIHYFEKLDKTWPLEYALQVASFGQ